MNDDANHWKDDRCARAFWDQHKSLPYLQLRADTAAWTEPRPGERWLDLGCGGGQLTKELWRHSQGRVEQIVACDCAAANVDAINALAARLHPAPKPGQITFVQADFSAGLPQFETGTFDGVVAGLCICYAEHRDPVSGAYTDLAFNRLLAEVYRVLKPGGRFVASTVVAEPRWSKIVWASIRPGIKVSRPFSQLVNTLRMMRYGRWLTSQARRGRFHYLPLDTVLDRFAGAGFAGCQSRLTYAGQSYLIRGEKRAECAARAA